ncbi:MAG: ATP-grasp domain-containing protein [Clostridium sp.]|uniref:Carbamoyl-phosphate-synthetase n=1 Tax=Acetivibrio saccincola TaxID=1677857 RepID=A0A2S8REW2_9FIRM|nr:ATP-grasp domain-containing protein [Clostridium sp.]PQQ68322.1 carbamoyl-phosphate-synthetase [Acetivibrio saccincola]
MKKILLLGGSTQQIPAIEYANKAGYYTVLCDYLPDNPGQKYANKFYCVSTTDKEAVLEVAEKEKIDGIVAYASDPAAPTAAYVAEKLGLPSNSYKAVETLGFKDKFREFLKENRFNYPKMEVFEDFNDVKKTVENFKFPLMVKPVDSSGSKGVNKIESSNDLETAFKSALEQSRNKKVIIEEYIVKDHKYLIGGDCFVLNGKVEFWGLLNCHRNMNVNPLVPVGKSYPVEISEDRFLLIKKEIQRIVDLLDIKFGGFNLEIMFDKKGDLYIIEMGPRNGGNMIPDLLNMITGVDLIAATVEAAMGNFDIDLSYSANEAYFSSFNIHTGKNGILKDIIFDEKIEKKIIKKVMYKKQGDTVQYFDGANKALGIVFFKFDSMEEMLNTMDNSDKWIKIVVE